MLGFIASEAGKHLPDIRLFQERHRACRRVLGPEDATTLIERLPPVGWADVATKRDLDALELRLDQRFVAVDQRFVAIDQRFDHLTQVFDERFGFQARSTDARFDRVDERFVAVDQRFDQQAQSFDARFDLVDERINASKHELIGTLHRELNAQTKTMMFGIVTIVLTMATLAFALVRFT